MKTIKISIFYILVLLIPIYAMASTTILTYHAPDNNKDTRKLYEIELLTLALDNTKDKYGNYKLIPSNKMNAKRALLSLQENKIKNFILKYSVSYEFLKNFSFSLFPVDRGVVGYRVSFISPKMKEKIDEIKSLEQLKDLRIGQGAGWLDNHILKSNGLNVISISNYESIFKMLILNRIDLFPRGINEVLGEYKAYNTSKNLHYDKTFAFYYPLPRFFFMHKENEKISKRIEEGLMIGYHNGSLDKLFEKYYQPSIDFVKMNQRKIYDINNPFLIDVNRYYEKYNYNFLRE